MINPSLSELTGLVCQNNGNLSVNKLEALFTVLEKVGQPSTLHCLSTVSDLAVEIIKKTDEGMQPSVAGTICKSLSASDDTGFPTGNGSFLNASSVAADMVKEVGDGKKVEVAAYSYNGFLEGGATAAAASLTTLMLRGGLELEDRSKYHNLCAELIQNNPRASYKDALTNALNELSVED